MTSLSNSDDQISLRGYHRNGILKEITIKILIVGDYAVGKTSIVRQYAEGRFSSNYKITIGADFSIKSVTWDTNTKLNIQLWDIAGNERFGAMTRAYYKYATAAVVVFDVSRISTFHSVQKWLNDLRDKVSLSDGTPIPVIIMANKSDISGSSVPTDAIEKLCKEWNIKKWYLTSAKDNCNIEEGMMYLISCAMEYKQREIFPITDTITVDSQNDGNIKDKNCCS